MFKFVGALIKIQISTVSMIYTTFLFLVNPNTTPHFADALHSILNPLMITRWSIFLLYVPTERCFSDSVQTGFGADT
jgi:hypothetical protein